jgi:hypothetical protein
VARSTEGRLPLRHAVRIFLSFFPWLLIVYLVRSDHWRTSYAAAECQLGKPDLVTAATPVHLFHLVRARDHGSVSVRSHLPFLLATFSPRKTRSTWSNSWTTRTIRQNS